MKTAITKRIGMAVVASAIALGGVGAVDLAKPVHKAEAASYYGVSANMTKSNYYAPEDAVLKLKNDNSYGMTVIEMLEKKQPDGTYDFIEYSTIIKLQPGQAYTHTYDTTFSDTWEVWDHNVTKTFRTKVMVYKGIQSDWSTDKLTYLGNMYTNPFNVTFQ